LIRRTSFPYFETEGSLERKTGFDFSRIDKMPDNLKKHSKRRPFEEVHPLGVNMGNYYKN
jgi:hypothetical protein